MREKMKGESMLSWIQSCKRRLSDLKADVKPVDHEACDVCPSFLLDQELRRFFFSTCSNFVYVYRTLWPLITVTRRGEWRSLFNIYTINRSELWLREARKSTKHWGHSSRTVQVVIVSFNLSVDGEKTRRKRIIRGKSRRRGRCRV